MTERSGAERQPRDQDAGARQHPQPPAAVLAGRPRAVQGRSRPGAAPRVPFPPRPSPAADGKFARRSKSRRCRRAAGDAALPGGCVAPGRGGCVSLAVRCARRESSWRKRLSPLPGLPASLCEAAKRGCGRVGGLRAGCRGARSTGTQSPRSLPPAPPPPGRSCIGAQRRRWAAGAGSAGLARCARPVAVPLERAAI